MLTNGIIRLKVFVGPGESTLYLNPRQIIYTLLYEKAVDFECRDGETRKSYGEVVMPGGAFQIHSQEEALEVAQGYMAKPGPMISM